MLTLSPAGNGHGPGARVRPAHLERGLMIWTVVHLPAAAAVLKRFAWPALLGAVEARETGAGGAARRGGAQPRRSGGAPGRAQEADRRRPGARRTPCWWRPATMAEKERALAMEKTQQEQQELLARARREIERGARPRRGRASARGGGPLPRRGLQADRRSGSTARRTASWCGVSSPAWTPGIGSRRPSPATMPRRCSSWASGAGSTDRATRS